MINDKQFHKLMSLIKRKYKNFAKQNGDEFLGVVNLWRWDPKGEFRPPIVVVQRFLKLHEKADQLCVFVRYDAPETEPWMTQIIACFALHKPITIGQKLDDYLALCPNPPRRFFEIEP